MTKGERLKSYGKLAELLKQNDITAYRLCRDTGIAEATISSWKHGEYIPKVEKLYKIAKYFDVPIEYFLS